MASPDCVPTGTERWWKSAAAFLLLLAAAVEAEIRCFCNEPACVSTGYMCKTESGHCFAAGRERRGCRRGPCPRPLLCCRQDMCNYVDLYGPDTGRTPLEGAPFSDSERELLEAALRRDVWFKAAVIAVPVAGACALLLLAMAAARMLRRDAANRRRFFLLRSAEGGCRCGATPERPPSCCVGHSMEEDLLPKSVTAL